jgi:hypothetical protein
MWWPENRCLGELFVLRESTFRKSSSLRGGDEREIKVGLAEGSENCQTLSEGRRRKENETK